MTATHQVENITKQIRGGKAKPFAYAPPFTKVEEIIV